MLTQLWSTFVERCGLGNMTKGHPKSLKPVRAEKMLQAGGQCGGKVGGCSRVSGGWGDGAALRAI